MKINCNATHKILHQQIRRLAPLFTGMAVCAAGLVFQSQAWAQTQLIVNGGAESSTPGSAVFDDWTQWGGGGAFIGNASNPGAAPYDGNNYFKIWGNYNNATDYSGFYQQFGANPGESFSASGWIYQNSADGFGTDANHAYIEVEFKNASGTILADYQSGVYTNTWPQNEWISWPVTNEISPNPGMVSTLVAPAGTVSVQYDVVLELVNYGGGSVYLDDLSLLAYAPPPPVLSNLTPNDVILATNQAFTCTAVAQSGVITNVLVTVTAVNGLSFPTTTTTIYTNSSAAMAVTGLNTVTANVSLTLAANVTYTIVVQATDSNGYSATGTASFDTIQPVMVWEAEDFNYGGGQYINTPPDGGVNLYAGLVGVPGIDEDWIPAGGQSSNYRTLAEGEAVSMGGAYETPRQKFLNAVAAGDTTVLDYEVGYNSATDWLDYTRDFPTGKYNIYARLATVGSGVQLNIGMVGGDTTTANQTVTNLGSCSLSDNNWNGYLYCPLVDSFGNLISVPLSGVQTLRSTIDAGGNPNINFYMIVPATGSPYPGLLSSYPTGSHPFEPTNKFSFAVGPAQGSVINSSGIGLTLNGVNVTSQLGLTAGAANSWSGSVPVSPNTIYSAVITVTNTTQLASTFTINFDTFSQANYMWEAEDWDFNGGQFIDNPMPSYDPTISGGGLLETDSYCGFPADNPNNAGISGVDYVGSDSGATHVYRPFESPGTQVTSDYIRQKFYNATNLFQDANITDVNLGYWDGGFWLNYTRTYPTNNFYVYGRLAGGNGPFSGTTLSVVTSGVGTGTQTTNIIGTFADPNAAGWQTWHWVPLLNASGNLAVLPLGGVETLQLQSGGNINANYYMLVPAPATPAAVTLTVSLNGVQPEISFPTVSAHTYTLQYQSSLTGGAWTSLGSVTGNGATQSLTDTTTSGVSQRFYRVQIQ